MLDEIPANWEACILLFRGHLISKGLASRTVASYITGVRSRLKLDRVELQEKLYLMKLMHRAAKKCDVERLHSPVTKIILNQVLKRVDLVARNYFEVALWGAICSLAYHGIFRIGELVESEHALKSENILLEDDGRTLHCLQHSSKVMRPAQRPPVIVVHPTWTDFCPRKLVNLYSVERARAKQYWKIQPQQFFVQATGRRVTNSKCCMSFASVSNSFLACAPWNLACTASGLAKRQICSGLESQMKPS